VRLEAILAQIRKRRNAAERLRREKLTAGGIAVYIRTAFSMPLRKIRGMKAPWRQRITSTGALDEERGASDQKARNKDRLTGACAGNAAHPA